MMPRLPAIVSTDWPALLCAMSLPVIWLISAQLPFVSRDDGVGAAEAVATALVGSLLAGGLLVWRIVRVYRLFSRGRPVRARITRREVVRDRARLELAYDLGGASITSCTRVYNNRRAQALAVNQDVDILVDPESPHEAIVRDLYI
jgi:hypothetical protein